MLFLRTTCAVLALAALAGCGGGGGSETSAPSETTEASETTESTEASGMSDAAGATVEINTFQFEPDPITIESGTTILFKNNDKIDHTVTAGTRDNPTPEVFDGTLPEQGTTFELTLDEPGTYDYFCQIHPGEGMTAQIIVE